MYSSRRPPPSAVSDDRHSTAGGPYPYQSSPAPPYDPYRSPYDHRPTSDVSHLPTDPPYNQPQAPYAGGLSGEPQGHNRAHSRLPFFEAALARSRGETVYDPMPIQHPVVPNLSFHQPAPSYLLPADPNHPDISVGFRQSSTVRFASSNGAQSRSPSPVSEQGLDYHEYEDTDVEKALLFDDHMGARGVDHGQWNEKLSSLGLASDGGDLSLPPFRGTSGVPAIHVRGPTGSTLRSAPPDLTASTTQHFGPAPSGRVGRRTHNAAGHRRIKQTAELDDNGFFAVDMPIPTRLAQFLPVKGVEEQKSTR
jgi:chitin synthase